MRPYEKAPLRCFRCQEYGHVAAVCRGEKRCGRCGEGECGKECEKQVKCLHCEGKHYAGSAQSPNRIREVKVSKVREEKGVTYAEAVKSLEKKCEKVEIQRELSKQVERVSENSFCVDKKAFLAFMAMVLNCALEIESKSERIKMVVDAARRFLDIDDVSGEDLTETLNAAFAAPP